MPVHRFRRRIRVASLPRAAVLLAAALPLAGHPQDESQPTPPATSLAEVTNTATRTERRTDEVPATVTVAPAAEAEARGARDLKDLFRNEVDLSVRAASPRFTAAGASTGRAGNEGLNVRGLEGNQVLIVVDGIRAPAGFSFGPVATGRLDSLALDAMHTVEVLRGPASTQFGSDGLAGALALRTLQASDLLTPGKDAAGYARLGGQTLDDSLSASAAQAWRRGDWDALLVFGVRRGHEVDSQGANKALDSTRTAPNSLDYTQPSALAKLGWKLAPAHRLQATLEVVRRTIDTEVFSARTTPPAPPVPLPATAVLDLDAQDRIERTRASLQHRYEDLNAVWLHKADTQFYVQDSGTRQVAHEDRNTAADRVREGRYREQLVGFSAQGETSFGAPLTQRVSAGLDWSRNKITARRDGTVPPPGETFPSKPFPDTNYTLLGGFVQSEMQFGSLAVIPALRLDHFELDASQDGFTGATVVDLSDQALTPRLGAVWQVSDAFAPYAQWSRGFRAPAPNQVNNGFTNVAFNYRSIGNPDLEPERARSIEVGLRGQWVRLHWHLAAYHNRYRNFISQELVSGNFTAADPATFQFVNLSAARIRGAELRLRYEPSAAWQWRAAAATAHGNSTSQGTTVPLNTVEPVKLALGASYRSGDWSLRADVLHAASKKASRIAQPDAPASPLFAPPSYTTLDLGLSWRAQPKLTLYLNVDNVLDDTYWRWSDVRDLAADSAVKNAFTAPGRTASLVARLDF